MPIHAPGQRNSKNKSSTTRKIVAMLSLTAMVDMFSVLAIFLLNYNSTGQLVDVPADIKLPAADQTKEAKTAHVVSVSQKEIRVDRLVVGTLDDVKRQQDWMIQKLYIELKRALDEDRKKAKQNIKSALQTAVKGSTQTADDQQSWKRVSVQADKDVDFLSVKKIMFTVTEAGGEEINFAVSKESKPITAN